MPTPRSCPCVPSNVNVCVLVATLAPTVTWQVVAAPVVPAFECVLQTTVVPVVQLVQLHAWLTESSSEAVGDSPTKPNCSPDIVTDPSPVRPMLHRSVKLTIGAAHQPANIEWCRSLGATCQCGLRSIRTVEAERERGADHASNSHRLTHSAPFQTPSMARDRRHRHPARRCACGLVLGLERRRRCEVP